MNFREPLTLFVIILFSIGLSGCLNWAARAVNKLPNETALDKSYKYEGKIIIIGAGASGLAAAKIMEQNNIDYQILEATNRYGGRLKKDTSFADFPIDIGAEWLHSAPVSLNKLKGKKGLEVDEDLIPYHLSNTASWDGKKYTITPKWINNFIYNFMPESKFKNTTWYDFVDENIAKTVKHKIQFNAPVSKIDYSGQKVIVTTRNGNIYTADRVLLTVSIGILKSEDITFTPEISNERRIAIESINFHQGFKMALKFSEKFYPDAINCIVEKGEKVYYDIAFKKNAQTHVLGFLCTGDKTNEYYSLNSNQKIVDSLLEELDQMFQGKASEFYLGEYLIENWGQHEFTQGTWTTAFEEKKSTLKVLNQPLDNKVYFAGEIFDTYQQMGVPGAILSGYFTADKILTD